MSRWPWHAPCTSLHCVSVRVLVWVTIHHSGTANLPDWLRKSSTKAKMLILQKNMTLYCLYSNRVNTPTTGLYLGNCLCFLHDLNHAHHVPSSYAAIGDDVEVQTICLPQLRGRGEFYQALNLSTNTLLIQYAHTHTHVRARSGDTRLAIARYILTKQKP